MLTDDLRLLIALAATMAGLGAFLLCLAALEPIGAAARHLWLSLSPGAARQARFQAALASYRVLSAKRERKRR